MADADQKAQIIAALKKGDLQSVTIPVDGKETKLYVEANPRFRTLNIKDESGNIVKREQVEKKDMSKSQKLDEALNKDKTQTQKQNKTKIKGLSV